MAESLTDIKKVEDLIKAFVNNNYIIDSRPYALNILGVRNPNTIANKFDDAIYVLFIDDKKKWNAIKYKATTDPGTYWLKNPLSKLGTAILKAGQYKDAYEIGYHNRSKQPPRKHLALVQRGNVTVMRDYDRNSTLDFLSPREETGNNFGINIHRAAAQGETLDVGQFSAGCQVFADANDQAEFMKLAEKHAGLYGNSFTYTLIDEREIEKGKTRNNIFIIGGGILIFSYFLFTNYKGLKNV